MSYNIFQRHEMQLETLRLETENRVEQTRLKAEQEKFDELQRIRDEYRDNLDKLVSGEQNRSVDLVNMKNKL